MEQLGGVVPIALYIYLALGWRVRPVEASGTTIITGNLLTTENDEPVTGTLGNFQVLVNLETPVQAAAIATSSAITDIQAGQLALIPALL